VSRGASHRIESAIIAQQLWVMLAVSFVPCAVSADADRASEIDEIAQTAFRAAHGLPDIFDLLACTRRRSILVRSLRDDGKPDRILPQVGGMASWRVSSGEGDVWVKLLERHAGRPGMTAALQRRSPDQYVVLFDAGECGSHELLVHRSRSGDWQAEFRPSRLHDYAHAMLRKASTVRAIHELFACSGRYDAMVQVQSASDSRPAVLARVKGNSVWRLRGPAGEMRVHLLAAPRSEHTVTVTLVDDGGGGYRTVFSAVGCPSYALTYTTPGVLEPSAGEQCRVEPGEDRAPDDPWHWSEAHLAVGPGECSRDEDCEGGSSKPDDLASEPVRDLCAFSWYDWYEAERAWLGSAGACVEGRRCRADVECPVGSHCQVYERVIDRVAGTLQRARCRFAQTDASSPTDCTTATRSCPKRKVAWLD
jgi:hypothetical protein